MREAIASLTLQQALREAGCGIRFSCETPLPSHEHHLRHGLVSSEEPKLFQMFGEACLQISQISEGASIKSCTPSQISILMVDSGKWGVKAPTCCLFIYSSFLHRPSLGSPSSEQKEGFVLNFFFLIYFSLRKGGKVWVSLNDQRKRGRVVEGKRMKK